MIKQYFQKRKTRKLLREQLPPEVLERLRSGEEEMFVTDELIVAKFPKSENYVFVHGDFKGASEEQCNEALQRALKKLIAEKEE